MLLFIFTVCLCGYFKGINMISLYGFGASFGVMDPSPFVVKVNAFLKVAKLPHKVISGANNLKKSPKGKLPFISIQDQENELLIADSQHIFEHLSQNYPVTLDDFLTKEQQAQAYLLTKSLDENLYWCLVYSRWILEDTWPLVNKTFFSSMPLPLRWFVPNLIRKTVKKNLHGQGLGRHSKEEILTIADKSFSALSVLLGDKSYFYGDKPCSFDATAYSILCQFISVNYQNEFNDKAKSYTNLVSFCQRIEKEYY